MKTALHEGIDYIHIDRTQNLSVVWECGWESVVGGAGTLHEIPLHFRREHYHHIAEVPHRHHEFFALYIVRGGRGTRMVNGHAHSMARGDVFLMAPEIIHCYRAAVDLTVDAVYFHRRLWTPREWEILNELPDLAAYLCPGDEAFTARGNTDHFGHLSPEPHARVEAVLSEIRSEFKSQRLPLQLAARSRFLALLIQLAEWRATKAFNTAPARGVGIAEVLHFCDHNFHRDLSNDQLAGLMHFSEGHFRDVFNREVGMPPGAYLRHVRLQHAQKLLENKSLSVADIARLSGFGDSTLLGRAFKKAFGVSPMEFRKKVG